MEPATGRHGRVSGAMAQHDVDGRVNMIYTCIDSKMISKFATDEQEVKGAIASLSSKQIRLRHYHYQQRIPLGTASCELQARRRQCVSPGVVDGQAKSRVLQERHSLLMLSERRCACHNPKIVPPRPDRSH